jgi:hypothetical protein
MWDNLFFQILVYAGLVFFNLFFIVAFLVVFYLLIAIGSIKTKVDEFLDEAKITAQKVQDAAANASEATLSIASFLTPLNIFKNIFPKKKKQQEDSFFSRLFS